MQPFLPCNQGMFATMRWFFAIPVPWHWQGVPVMAVVSCMEVCRLKGRCRPGLVAAGVFGHAAFCGYGWPGATARRQWRRAGQCLHSGGHAVAWLTRLLYWPAKRPFCIAVRPVSGCQTAGVAGRCLRLLQVAGCEAFGCGWAYARRPWMHRPRLLAKLGWRAAVGCRHCMALPPSKICCGLLAGMQ